MNLRWLVGDFTESEFRLSVSDRHRISKRAHQIYLHVRILFWYSLFVVILPTLLVYKFVLPLVLDWLGFTGRALPLTIGIAALIVLFWVYSSWTYRMIYVKPVRRAMRDEGFDICITCGYDLRNLPAQTKRCPECGAERDVKTSCTEEPRQ